MIERYSRPGMAQIWSDESKFDLWLKIELAVCEARAKRGEIPEGALQTIKKKASYDIRRIAEIESEVHHDVIAFLSSVAERVGPDSRYIHLGMTSSDLLDTALALQLLKSSQIIGDDLKSLLDAVRKRAFDYKMTPMMGRSHGIHAEPITFGLKLALWYAEFSRHAERLNSAIDDISVGKMSGAVGTYAHIDPGIESEVLSDLGLRPDTVSTQIVQRDRHAHFFSILAGVATSIEKVAVEIRHLQRTEVSEVAEPFGRSQKGSSAMPHKRNPVLCENIAGLARIVRSNAMAAFEDVALWHERDISHSSVERVIAPDSTILVDFMLARLKDVVEGMDVYPERMMENIKNSLGLYASEDVLLALAGKGMTREDAYRIVQGAAIRAAREKRNFLEILKGEKAIVSKLSPDELAGLFDLRRHTRHVDAIFKRAFTVKQ